jgi:hypothetical protein
MNLLQAILLMYIYERESGVAESAICSDLGVPLQIVKAMLHPFFHCKFCKLLEEKDSTISIVRDKFSSPHRAFAVPHVNVKVKAVSENDMKLERREMINACMVRVMKSRKELPVESLIQETVRYLSKFFTPLVPDLKIQIADLIDKEYLEQLDGGVLKYLA